MSTLGQHTGVKKEFALYSLLFLLSSGIYFFYFPHVFLNINSVLSSITGDALKNYYTFSYHIKNDVSALHFDGMNFPFGEHVVFTDGQPLLANLLRLLPFTHNYLIGILHTLLFLSFCVSPLILLKILKRTGLDNFSGLFISLSITLLAPQFAKINGGHHALAYGCVIPLSILLCLNFIQAQNTGNLVKLSLYNFLLFFLHPYLGFSATLFTLLTGVIYLVLHFDRTKIRTGIFKLFITGLVPILVFKLFMYFTDRHPERTTEPHGSDKLIENLDSLLAAEFGPFQNFMQVLFPNRTDHLEGHSYLGFFTILLSFVFLILLPFYFRKMQIKKEFIALLLSALLLLFLSFGWHHSIFRFLHLSETSLNQFRATCRFAWYFYYLLPLFVVPVLYHLVRSKLTSGASGKVVMVISLLFFISHLAEANDYFKKDQSHFWKFRNVLNEKYLNTEEREIIKHLYKTKAQAIISLPVFCLGSEMYDRIGADNSMIPAYLYSFHTKIPILGTWLSRTSIPETEQMIELLNSYKKQKATDSLLSNSPFFVIKTNESLLADEDRLLSAVNFFKHNDSLAFGDLSTADLTKRKLDARVITIKSDTLADSNQIIFLDHLNRKPFLSANMKNYETIFVLDSNKLNDGDYIVSLHYHYTKKVYKSVGIFLIITKASGKDYRWQYNQSLSVMSGFYKGFGVSEYKIKLEKKSRYEFVLNGFEDLNYSISDFMLRPAGKSTLFISNKGDSIFNNFPH